MLTRSGLKHTGGVTNIGFVKGGGKNVGIFTVSVVGTDGGASVGIDGGANVGTDLGANIGAGFEAKVGADFGAKVGMVG